MQILFIRDAQSTVQQIEVTPKRVLWLLVWGILLIAVLNVVAGWLLTAIGFDEAETQSQSVSELQYERKLIELEAQITELNARLKGLDASRQQMLQEQPAQPGGLPVGVPTPVSVPVTPGQGGPMLQPMPQSATTQSFVTRLHRIELAALDLKSQSAQVEARLSTLHEFQLASPTGYPLPYLSQITSEPGYRMDPFTGRSSWHAGTDYAAYAGTPIMATGDGYVIRAEWDDDFGNVVEISHPGVNAVTLYAHAQEIYVRPGQRINRGEAIASVGSTGRSTGPHLHYEVR